MKKVICLSDDLIKVLKASPAFKSNPTNNYELDIFFSITAFSYFQRSAVSGSTLIIQSTEKYIFL